MLSFIKPQFQVLSFLSKRIHVSSTVLRISSQTHRPPPRQRKSSQSNVETNNEVHSDDVEETIDFIKRVSHTREIGHQALVIQPVVKWGQQKIIGTTPDLQLQEAVALAKTLPDWKVVESKVVKVKTLKTVKIFGPQVLENLKETVAKDHRITAIFISVNMLNGLQHRYLENYFQVPIFDRFTVVLKIFKDHAHTKEAMLQVALAEIPYLRVRLREMHEENKSWHSADLVHIGGSGGMFLDSRKQLLMDREVKIKQILEKLKAHRRLLRRARTVKKIPIIAVVGYTNAGKTSLIKTFTDEVNLIPKDQLFATLDVTAHAGRLPCNLKVIYMDTVGFISDIPTSLIASFNATLEDIVLADLIIHVRDISHPDTEYQNENVMRTLRQLDLPQNLIDSMIVVNNKIDQCQNTITDDNAMNVSATIGTGTYELHHEIQRQILKNTNQMTRIFRVKIGSEQERWLRRECGVEETLIDDERPNFYKLKCIISKDNFDKLCHVFNVRKIIKSS